MRVKSSYETHMEVSHVKVSVDWGYPTGDLTNLFRKEQYAATQQKKYKVNRMSKRERVKSKSDGSIPLGRVTTCYREDYLF